jgi:hypothetical protein
LTRVWKIIILFDTLITNFRKQHEEIEMMKTLLLSMLCLFCCATLLPAQTVTQGVAAAEGERAVGQLIEVHSTIMAIDKETRTVDLKSDEGEEFSVVVPEEAPNFYQLAVGDRVLIQYYEQITLLLEKAEEGMKGMSEKVASDHAKKGETPGGIEMREVTITAEIVAIDTEASTATLTGPQGRSVTLDVEPEKLAKVKVGDLVTAVYSEALAISVKKVEKK